MPDPVEGEIVRTRGLPDIRQHERSVARIQDGRVRVDHYYHQAPAPAAPASQPDDVLKRATPILVVAFICVILFAMVAALLMMLVPPFLLLMISVTQSAVSLAISAVSLIIGLAVASIAISAAIGHLRKTSDTSKIVEDAMQDRQ